MFKKNDSLESNSIIGEGSYFKGEFTLKGTLRVEGCYEGDKLEVDNVIIGQMGKVKSNIKSIAAVIEGIVVGNIEASSRVMLEGLCVIAPNPQTNPKETILSLYNSNNENSNLETN